MRSPAVLFRDAMVPASEAGCLLLTDIQSVWQIRDAASLREAMLAADLARKEGAYIVFALDYELGQLLEPAVTKGIDTVLPPTPRGYVWRFENASRLTCGEADAWLLSRGKPGPAGCVRSLHPEMPAFYEETLAKIHQAIADGAVYQINYTFPMDVTLYGDPANVFLNLARAQPTAHAVYMDLPEMQVLSLSPELFFSVDSARITVKPMKGTAARSLDIVDDEKQASGLRASEKNRAENLMIVDLLRNDLGRIARPGSVQVETLFDIEAYPTVHQMTSTVSARLLTDQLDPMIRSLFPCGSVTGAPKVAAMQKINEWEIAPRGLYTGTIGWATTERVQANVAIRTIVLDPPANHDNCASEAVRTGVLGVGSGIVWDSLAHEEYAECLLKSDFLVRSDPGFTLFETLRLELPPEDLSETLPLVEIYPLVRRHASRLARSAYALGFAFNQGLFEQSLWHVKQEIRQHQGTGGTSRSFRIRVDLSHGGALKTTWAPLPPLSERLALIWADTRLSSDAPLLRHKTSMRERYDAAVEQALVQQAFDALFCNEYGQVCEGARSNVFVREGNRLLTPPIRCGLLPGVFREAMIESGEACEAILTVGDIKAASREGRLRVGNALRGLMPAYLK
jgi:para-aminobenzoate synthetase/4-amino-4-deoxychorismate lyase